MAVLQSRCGMIAHTSLTITGSTMWWAMSATLDMDNETSFRGRYAKPAAAELISDDADTLYAFARDTAGPVYLDIGVFNPSDPLAWNLPQHEDDEVITEMKSSILTLQQALPPIIADIENIYLTIEDLTDPDASYLADPGDFVPAFATNL